MNTKAHEALSEKERDARRRAFAYARATIQLESRARMYSEVNHADQIAEQYLNGSMTLQEFRDEPRLVGDKLVPIYPVSGKSRVQGELPRFTAEEMRSIEEHGAEIAALELYLSPVAGSYDSAHLREIHRRLFRHMEEHGFGEEYTPGVYRPAVKDEFSRTKERFLDSFGVEVVMVRSSMDEEAQKRIEEALKSAQAQELSKLDQKHFAQTIGEIFAELDYLHPFKDGNSRAIREITRQLAAESGFELDWSVFNKNQQSRDYWYLIRENSIKDLSVAHIKSQSLKAKVIGSLEEQFDGLVNNGELILKFKAISPLASKERS